MTTATSKNLICATFHHLSLSSTCWNPWYLITLIYPQCGFRGLSATRTRQKVCSQLRESLLEVFTLLCARSQGPGHEEATRPAGVRARDAENQPAPVRVLQPHLRAGGREHHCDHGGAGDDPRPGGPGWWGPSNGTAGWDPWCMSTRSSLWSVFMGQNLPVFVFSSLPPPASSLFQKETEGSVHSKDLSSTPCPMAHKRYAAFVRTTAILRYFMRSDLKHFQVDL